MSEFGDKHKNEDYVGPSRIGNAYAKALAVNSLTTIPIGAITVGKASYDLYNLAKNAEKFEEEGTEVALKIGGKSALIGLGLLAASTALGAVWGWRQASKSQQQHTELVNERNALLDKVDQLVLKDDIHKTQLSWVERTGRNPAELMTDRVEQYHSPDGASPAL